MNEDEISKTLDRVVPHREVPKGLLAGARRRRQRVRTLTGAAAVALVAALAIPLGMTMGGSNHQVLATPAPTAMNTASHDEYCNVDADGRMATSDLPNNTLPNEPQAVWLCSAIRQPMEPLVGKEATQQVVDSFQELSTSPPNDRLPTASYSYLVVVYPDGRHYVVQVDRGHPFEVVWGAERQHVRRSSPEWVVNLEKLWVEQRDHNPQDPPIAPSGGVCDYITRSLGRPIDRYDEGGALCTITRTDAGDSKTVEVPASPQLIADVHAEAQEFSVPWLPDEDNPLRVWEGDAILLVDDYGDRTLLIRGSGDRWYWREGGDVLKWTPSPDLAARLAQTFEEGRPSPQPTHS